MTACRESLRSGKHKWFQQFNLDLEDGGAHYTVEQVNAFVVPEVKYLMAYYGIVREQTKQYLNSLTPGAFDNILTLPRFGDITLAALFSMIVTHTSQHIGEISYLRGVQRGMDK
jgi:hypothetical protein